MARRDKQVPDTGSHNQINPGTKIEGNLHASESIRLDGQMEGDLHCDGKVVVGPKGTVQGNIHCQQLDLYGQITGDVIAKELVMLRNSAKLEGSIQTQGLSIESGATFEGSCTMQTKHAS